MLSNDLAVPVWVSCGCRSPDDAL